MKERNIGLGVFLLSIGIMWLLLNLGVINWSIFDSLFTLWPLILVIVGVNVIFKHNPIVKLVAWLVFLAILIGYSYINGGSYNNGAQNSRNVAIVKESDTKYGEFDLGLGGMNIELGPTGTNLVDAVISAPNVNNSVDYKNGKETATVKFDQRNVHVFNRNMVNGYSRFNLNDGIIWNMDLKVGAVKGTFDMSKLKVRDLKVSTGAGKLDLILGANYGSASVRIDAGASSIDLTIPEGTGVKVRMDGAINSTNLTELGWQKNGNEYTSPNYDTASNKTDVRVNMGVGRFNINMGSKPIS